MAVRRKNHDSAEGMTLPVEAPIAADESIAHGAPDMAMVITFLLGIANFALQRAVLDSGHPALRSLPPALQRNAPRWALASEFMLLAGALYMVSVGETYWGWAYLGYSIINLVGAWAILTRRF